MPLILPGNVGSATAATGYDVANSLRFNGASDDSLNKTLGTPTNNLKWTISFWLKRTELGVEDAIMTSYTNNQNRGMLLFRTDDQLEILDLQSDSYVMQKKTNRQFSDVSAWYHIVISSDATLSSPATKFYVNGVEETSFATTNEYTQNQANKWNSAIANHIGNDSSTRDFSGYLAEFVFIDGQALAADQFGEFDSDTPTVWKPIDVSGLTFGDNGFYFEFKQSGTGTDANGMGADTSGNTNHFAVNNLTAVDQSTDTCTNNFATLNPLYTNNGAITYSEGNLKAVAGSGSTSWTTRYGFSSIGVSAGRWYVEAKCVDSGGSNQFYFGVAKDVETWNFNSSLGYENTGQGWGYYASNGNIVNNESDLYTSGNSYTDGDIISMELDLEDMTLDFYKNGAKEGYQVTSLPAGTYHFAINGYAAIDGEFNFGSPPYSISSGNTDGNGYGNFEYSVPSGHYALNTKNLAEFG
jgi:hypothetical protein